MKTLLAVTFVLGLAACGDKSQPAASASGTAKADSKPAATGAATGSAAPKKDDSGW